MTDFTRDSFSSATTLRAFAGSATGRVASACLAFSAGAAAMGVVEPGSMVWIAMRTAMSLSAVSTWAEFLGDVARWAW